MNEVETYLKSLPPASRATLEKLRETIRAVIPQATEVLSYGMPTFKLDKGIVAYAAFKDHCSLFPMSATILDQFGDEIAAYRASKGTLHIPIGGSLPTALVKKLVKARVAENQAIANQRAAKQPKRKER
ncbi:DUF1801 domain-containing protein [candidate division KSB1 bacterium]|nr:DUF1801 domain-containing protein [candidate division KSB1 bacterium]